MNARLAVALASSALICCASPPPLTPEPPPPPPAVSTAASAPAPPTASASAPPASPPPPAFVAKPGCSGDNLDLDKIFRALPAGPAKEDASCSYRGEPLDLAAAGGPDSIQLDAKLTPNPAKPGGSVSLVVTLTNVAKEARTIVLSSCSGDPLLSAQANDAKGERADTVPSDFGCGVSRGCSSAVAAITLSAGGHSTGGTVALLAAYGNGHDDRLRAVIPISADSCFFSESFFATRSVPLLAMTGTRDLLVPPPDNIDRTYQLAGAPKVFASLVGGSHLFFTDYPLDDALIGGMPTTAASDLAKTLSGYGDGAACEPIPPPSNDAKLGFDEQHALTVKIIVAYLAHVLRGNDGALAMIETAGDAKVKIAHDP